MEDISVAPLSNFFITKQNTQRQIGVLRRVKTYNIIKKYAKLKAVAPHYRGYISESKKIQNIFKDYTKTVIPYGKGQAWLDLSYLKNSYNQATPIANSIKRRIKHELGISCSIVINYNCIFTKIGMEYKKPDSGIMINIRIE